MHTRMVICPHPTPQPSLVVIIFWLASVSYLCHILTMKINPPVRFAFKLGGRVGFQPLPLWSLAAAKLRGAWAHFVGCGVLGRTLWCGLPVKSFQQLPLPFFELCDSTGGGRPCLLS